MKRQLGTMAWACIALASGTASAQIRDGNYDGTMACGALLTNPQQGPWSQPLKLQVSGNSVQWDRSSPQFSETGTGTLQNGKINLSLAGGWNPGQKNTGRWRTMAALNLDGRTLSGPATMYSADGAQRVRDCTVRVSVEVYEGAAAASTQPQEPAGRAMAQPFSGPGASDQKGLQVTAYDKAQTKTALDRSAFYLPLFGTVYRDKFSAALPRHPGVRGLVIHNHGCGGMWGWETTVAQFYYREGFAVITPEFVTREGNKLGCPGGTPEEMLKRAGERAREVVYSAMNPARLDARGDDIAEVIRWFKTFSNLPIFLSGHSEGCRTTYHWDRADPQVVGGICHKQSVNRQYEHLWKWDTRLPMWSSIEDEDPWAGGSKQHPAVGFDEKFKDHPQNLTVFRYAGDSHDPLVRPGEGQSLRDWLNKQVSTPVQRTQNGFNYEDVLPAVQDAVSRSNR